MHKNCLKSQFFGVPEVMKLVIAYRYENIVSRTFLVMTMAMNSDYFVVEV